MQSYQRDRLIAFAVSVVVFFLYLPGLNYHKLLGEFFYNTPLRILNGELPGKDVHIHYGVLRYYLWALMYVLFGVKTVTLRILAPVTLALMSGSAYLVARKLRINLLLSLICAVVVLHTMTATYAIDYFSPISDRHLFAFIGILIVHQLISSHSRKLYVIAGLYIAVTISFAQETGIYLLAAYLAFMGVIGIITVKGKYSYISLRELSQRNVFALAGFAAYMIPLILYLSGKGILLNIYQDLFVDISKLYSYGHLNFSNLASLAVVPQSFSVQDLKFSFLIFRFFFIIGLYAGIGIWIFKKILRSQNVSNDKLFLTFVLLYGVFSAFTAIRAFDSQHVTFISQPFYFLAVWTLQQIYRSFQAAADPPAAEKQPRRSENLQFNAGRLKSLLSTIMVLIIAANLLFSALIVCKVLINTYLLKGFEFSSVHAPNILVVDTPELRDYTAALQYIQDEVPEGEPVFSLEKANAVTNFLVNRPNVTEYDVAHHFVLSQELRSRELPKIINQISSVRYILIWRKMVERENNTGSDLYRGETNIPFEYYYQDYYDYVFKYFRMDKKFGTFEVWIRKD